MENQTPLLYIARALHPTRCFAGGLDRWKQQAYKHADDSNHHQQFHESERSVLA
jgi:hypothetical protein